MTWRLWPTMNRFVEKVICESLMWLWMIQYLQVIDTKCSEAVDMKTVCACACACVFHCVAHKCWY